MESRAGANMQQNDEKSAEKLMDEHLRRNGLFRKKIAKDGSCLFRAVAEQVLRCQGLHTKVRSDCVKYLKQHRDLYESFIEGDFEEYLQRLQDPQSWVGQVEISALAVLYRHDFIIYQQPGEPPVNITQKGFPDKVQLCFLNGNHYDSVYPMTVARATAECQSILYELLYERVYGITSGAIKSSLKAAEARDEATDVQQRYSSGESDLDEGEDFWSGEASLRAAGVNNRPPKGRGRGHPRGGGRGCLPQKVQDCLNPSLFRNVEYDVWLQSEKVQQRRDFYMAAGMHYQAGDKCQVRLGNGQTYSAYIQDVSSDDGPVTVFIEERGEKHTVPLWNLRTPTEQSWRTVTDKSKKHAAPGNSSHANERESRSGRKPFRSVSYAAPSGSGSSSGSSKLQQQHLWPSQTPEEIQPLGKSTSRRADEDLGGLCVSPEEKDEHVLLELLHKDEENFPSLEASAQAAGNEGGKKAEKKGRKKAETESKEQKPGQKAERGKAAAFVDPDQKSSSKVKEEPSAPPSAPLPTASPRKATKSPPAKTTQVPSKIPSVPQLLRTTPAPSAKPPITSQTAPTPAPSAKPPVTSQTAPTTSTSAKPPVTSQTAPTPSPSAKPPVTSQTPAHTPPTRSSVVTLVPPQPTPPPQSQPPPTNPSQASSEVSATAPPAVPVPESAPVTVPSQPPLTSPASNPVTPPVPTPPLSKPPSASLEPSPVPSQPALLTALPPVTPAPADPPAAQNTPPPPSPPPVSAHTPPPAPFHPVGPDAGPYPPYPTCTAHVPVSTPPLSAPMPTPLSALTPPYVPPTEPRPYDPCVTSVAGGSGAPVPDFQPLHPLALAQISQDPLYPGFPQNNRDERVRTPPLFSFQRDGKDLPNDTAVLRFFYNLGLKAYMYPAFPPYSYLAPLTHAYNMQPKIPPPPLPWQMENPRPPYPAHSSSPASTPPMGQFEMRGVAPPLPPPEAFGHHPAPMLPGNVYTGVFPGPPVGTFLPYPGPPPSSGHPRASAPPPMHGGLEIPMDGGHAQSSLAPPPLWPGQPPMVVSSPALVPVTMETQGAGKAAPPLMMPNGNRRDDDALSDWDPERAEHADVDLTGGRSFYSQSYRTGRHAQGDGGYPRRGSRGRRDFGGRGRPDGHSPYPRGSGTRTRGRGYTQHGSARAGYAGAQFAPAANS